jgi:hypothetical protein
VHVADARVSPSLAEQAGARRKRQVARYDEEGCRVRSHKAKVAGHGVGCPGRAGLPPNPVAQLRERALRTGNLRCYHFCGAARPSSGPSRSSATDDEPDFRGTKRMTARWTVAGLELGADRGSSGWPTLGRSAAEPKPSMGDRQPETTPGQERKKTVALLRLCPKCVPQLALASSLGGACARHHARARQTRDLEIFALWKQ